VRDGKIQLKNEVIQAADGFPLEVKNIIFNLQEFIKTVNSWGVSNNMKEPCYNHLELFH